MADAGGSLRSEASAFATARGLPVDGIDRVNAARAHAHTRGGGARRLLARCGLSIVLGLGCAQVFGIDEACVAGEPGCTPLSGACETDLAVLATNDPGGEACAEYCRIIGMSCSARPQYADEMDCLSLCPHLPRAADGNPRAANTLECRVAVAQTIVETSDCDAAGRSGNGGCGSNCDSYCSLMRSLCPENFCRFARSSPLEDDEAACQAHCATLLDRGEFDPRAMGSSDEFETDDNGPKAATVQCRLWHLGRAAAVFDSMGQRNNLHCQHAIAASNCIGPPTPL